MIKGVNKKVLEINNPQSIYFEKAVLYLKPNMNCAPEKLVRREANEFIRGVSPKSSKYTTFLKVFMFLSLSFSAIGAGIYFLSTANL